MTLRSSRAPRPGIPQRLRGGPTGRGRTRPGPVPRYRRRMRLPKSAIQRLRPIAQRVWPYALLMVTLWVVRYWHSAAFGFYEDDLTHLPRAAAMSLGEVFAFAFDPARIANLYGQGHPLHYTFIYLLTNLGWRLGGIQGPYWLGFCVQAVNLCLFYALLRRIHSQALGVLGGLAYVLYSADTTQAYLTYSLGLHS